MLVHTSDRKPGIRRKGAGTGFFYLHPNGRKVKDRSTLERIDRLAIPPAYADVWICRRENGHLQATGWDSRRRKQYLYHPEWLEERSLEKFDRLFAIGRGLPRLRRRVRAELKRDGIGREKMVAAAVRLIDKLGLRVGGDSYLRENGTRGVSTLAKENLTLSSSAPAIRIEFVGKGGKVVSTEFSNPLLEETLADCHELPGQRLFSFHDSDGRKFTIDSGDINDFLAESIEDDVTAKELRTWRASVEVADRLRKISVPEDREKEIRGAIRSVATMIGNRYAVCRKHYVHPDLLDAYRESGRWGISRHRPKPISGLHLAETLLLQLLGQQR